MIIKVVDLSSLSSSPSNPYTYLWSIPPEPVRPYPSIRTSIYSKWEVCPLHGRAIHHHSIQPQTSRIDQCFRSTLKLCVQGYSAIGSIVSHLIDDANPNLASGFGVGHECFDRNLLESIIIGRICPRWILWVYVKVVYVQGITWTWGSGVRRLCESPSFTCVLSLVGRM